LKKIIVDTREAKELEIVKIFRTKPYLEIERTELFVGDYLIGNFVIERKTTADFISSFYDNRLKSQLDNLPLVRDGGQIPVLLLEGNWYKAKNGRNISWTQINEALNILQLNQEVVLMPTENQKQSAYRIISLGFWNEEKTLNTQHKAMKKEWTIREKQIYLLKSFRGVGEKTAEEIIDENEGDIYSFFTEVYTHTQKSKVKQEIQRVLKGK
jgi:ERCC4-type nuclease